MKQLADGVFEVPSDSDYSRTYVVNLTGKYPQCTCMAWAMSRNRAVRDGGVPKPCKHCRQAMNADPSSMKRINAQKAQAEADAKAAAAAAKTAESEKMKAELLKMRAELRGEKPTPKPKPNAEERRDAIHAARLIGRKEEPADLLAQLEAQIKANKEKK